jgi:hypothetical protein
VKRSNVSLCVVSLCLLGTVVPTATYSQRRKTLQTAVRQGDMEAIKQFIANGADLNEVEYGRTPLTAAVESMQPEAIRTLLEAGADPNAKDGRGRTALHEACARSQADTIDLLLAKGADVNVSNAEGQTPLHIASGLPQREIVEKLLDAGADINAQDNRRQTPLSVARSRRQRDIAALLEERGGTVPAVQRYGPGYEEEMMYSEAASAGTSSAGGWGAPSARRDLLADPNLVQQALETIATMRPVLEAFDANSATEQRSWAQRRIDNRTSLIRSVEKQFMEEMAFVKKTALSENAEKTAEAVDDLVATRTKRYEVVGDELRAQRREMLRSEQAERRGRGRRGVRGGYTNDSSMGGYTDNAYSPMYQPAVQSDPNAPPLPPETEAQLQAWLGAGPEEKITLLNAVHELDLAELGNLYEVAEEEEASKTAATILVFMSTRQARVEAVVDKIHETEARLQRLRERQEAMQGGAGYRGRGRGTRGGYEQDDRSTGSRRGRRYR